MTIEANHGPVPLRAPSLVLSGERDRSRAFISARRHTILVRALKALLPLCALAVCGYYFIDHIMRTGLSVSLGKFDASIDRLEITRDSLRMVNPRIEGVTNDGGRFAVKADYAEPLDENKVIRLSGVSGRMTATNGKWAQVTAPAGTYRSEGEKLTLSGKIEVTSDGGMTAHLASADIDMKKQLVSSDKPVTVTMLNGEIRALRLRIEAAVSEVLFDGDVRLHIERPAGAAKPEAAGAKSVGLASFSSREPIDIASPQLKIFDKQKTARFLGGVTAIQGTSRLTAKEMKVDYEGSSPAASQTSKATIKRIEAIDEVRLVSSDGRQATARRMIYDVQNGTVTLDGDVALSQNGDVMKGERFVMDLATGKSRFEPGGRVSSHIAARGSPASPRKPAQSGGPLGASQLDLSSTRGQPIDIQSDTVTLDDRAKVAVFAGDVRVVQGDMTLQSRELHVNYSGSATGGASANAAASQITSITAEGKVLVTSKDQSSTSDWAKFDAASHTITIGGNVVLSQGQNVIKGDRLVIDTITGRSRFENERDQATGGRVRGLFQPKSDRDGTGRTGNSGLPFGGMASPR